MYAAEFRMARLCRVPTRFSEKRILLDLPPCYEGPLQSQKPKLWFLDKALRQHQAQWRGETRFSNRPPMVVERNQILARSKRTVWVLTIRVMLLSSRLAGNSPTDLKQRPHFYFCGGVCLV